MSVYDRVRAFTPTTGAGPLTPGPAVSTGFRDFGAVVEGDSVPYVIEDRFWHGVPTAFEVGTGVWSAGRLSRTVASSSAGGAALDLSGFAVVRIAPAADYFNSRAAADLSNVPAVTQAALAAAYGLRENILPNTQFEVCTATLPCVRLLPDHSGPEPAIAVSAYTTGANLVTCTTSNTQNLAVGDFVSFSSAADANLCICMARVLALSVNASFQVRLPANKTAATSAACTATIMERGDFDGIGGSAQDGWLKSAPPDLTTPGLSFFRNTRPQYVPPGCVYSGYFRKSISAGQYLLREVSDEQVRDYAGRQIVLGCWIRKATTVASGTARLLINSVVGGSGTITYGQPMASSPVVGGWTWLTVTAVIPTVVDHIDMGVSFDGGAGDIYYVGGMHGQIGVFLAPGAYNRPANEMLFPYVKITPESYYNQSITFPPTQTPGTNYYDVAFDCAAETDLVISPSVTVIDHAQAEGYNATVNRAMAFRNIAGPSGIKFGMHPIYSPASNVFSTVGELWTLDQEGGGIIYAIFASDNWAGVSIDLNAFILNATRGAIY